MNGVAQDKSKPSREHSAPESAGSTAQAVDLSNPKFHLGFGVGCFHFASRRKSDDVDEAKYFGDVKEFLLSDKLVTNVDILPTDHSLILFQDPDGNATDSISDTRNLYPHVQDCVIRIEMHIPENSEIVYWFMEGACWRKPYR